MESPYIIIIGFKCTPYTIIVTLVEVFQDTFIYDINQPTQYKVEPLPYLFQWH